jgi:hypothetical protein
MRFYIPVNESYVVLLGGVHSCTGRPVIKLIPSVMSVKNPNNTAAIILAYNVWECEMRAKTAWHGELSILMRLCRNPLKSGGTQ